MRNGEAVRDPSNIRFVGEVYKGSGISEPNRESKNFGNSMLARNSGFEKVELPEGYQ